MKVTLPKSFLKLFFVLFILHNQYGFGQYCTATVVGTATNVGIANVSFSNLNYSSATEEGYRNYTANIATVYRSHQYPLNISTGPAKQKIKSWVDWNQDGDFADAGENIASGGVSLGAYYSTTITIPTSALVGTTRMRISTNSNGNPVDSCTTTQAAGDVEDYTLLIKDTIIATTTQYLSPEFTNPASDKKVLGIEIFSSNNYILSSLHFNTTGTSNIAAISNAKVFYSGSNYSTMSTQVGSTVVSPNGAFIVNGNFTLQPGDNYFWLTYDVNGSIGDVIDAQMTSLVANGVSYTPTVISPAPSLTIQPAVCTYNPKRNNIWYFGDHAGIDFNTGSAVAITNSAMNQFEGSASIADMNGNILFYTSGDTVWNKNHIPMPNGFGLGGNGSATQSGMILQQPANNNIYYIFTTAAIENFAATAEQGFYYSIIDMSQNGGLGDVIVKKVKLVQYSSEKQVAISHSNNTDIWIMSHDCRGGNTYYAYLLTATDLKNPTINNIGAPLVDVFEGIGAIKGSPNGKKVAATITGNGTSTAGTGNWAEVFDFNNSTGVLSNLKTLTFTEYPYGVEFSPNSNVLYITENHSGALNQFDATQTSSAAMAASKTILFPNSTGGALELAPDGKIYAALAISLLGVINNPDILGMGCSYAPVSFSLAGKYSGIGLPNTFKPIFTLSVAVNNATTCPGITTTLTAIATPTSGTTYSWLPGNMSSSSIAITPTTSSNYTVIATNAGCTVSAVSAVTTSANVTPVTTFSYTSPVCINGTNPAPNLAPGFISGGTYTSTAGLSINPSSGMINLGASNSGTYVVTYSVAASGCFAAGTHSASIVLAPSPTITVNSPTICPGATTTLTATTNFPSGTTYSWSSGGITTSTISVTTNTTNNYTVTAINGGCSATEVSTVTVSNSINPVTTFSYTSPICVNSTNPVPVLASGFTSGGIYTTNPSLSINATTGIINLAASNSGTYAVTYSVAATGCVVSGSSTATIIIVPSPTLTVNSLTLCSGTTATLTATVNPLSGTTYSWLPVGTATPTIAVTPTITSNYTIIATNSGCSSSAISSVTVNPNSNPITGFSYTSSPVCINGSNPVPTPVVGFTSGGTYVSTAGLAINPTTGIINLATSTAGTYVVSYSVAATGCAIAGTHTTSIVITSTTAPITSFSYPASVCLSDANPVPTPVAGFTSGGTYSSTPGLTINSSTGIINLVSSTASTYTVTYSLAATGCVIAGTGIATISINSAPILTLSPNVTILSGASTTLNVSGSNSSYTWTPTFGLSCANCTSPLASPIETTTYCVSSSMGSCTAQACMVVNVEVSCASNKVYGVPNAFSPNGDGYNDEFCLQGWKGCVNSFYISIYDRWGEKVFESADENFCWDAKYKGQTLEPAVFVFYMNADIINIGSMTKKGNITLIK